MALKDFRKPDPGLPRTERIELEIKAAAEFGLHLIQPIPPGERFRCGRSTPMPVPASVARHPVSPWPHGERAGGAVSRPVSPAAQGSLLDALSGRLERLQRDLLSEIESVDARQLAAELPRLARSVEALAALGAAAPAAQELAAHLARRIFAGVHFRDLAGTGGGEPAGQG